MIRFRRLAVVALAIAYAHIVFGAIVRITGSGLGCGDHWPRCHGYWIPPFARPDLIIEVTHRYLALALSLAVLALLAAAWRRRREPGVSGAGGVLRPSALGAVLVVAAALLGAVVVKLGLTNKYVIVLHLALAMSLLGALVVAAIRAGGLGAGRLDPAGSPASARTARGAAAAAGLAFTAIVLGGLTAHLPGANAACQGFPHCARGVLAEGAILHVHLAHRVLAFLLLLHSLGLMLGAARRREPRPLVALARAGFATVLAQILVAAALVEMQLPAVLRSLHQAVGTLVWIVFVLLAALARRPVAGAEDLAPVPPPPLPPLPQRQPHSMAVIVARGADF